MRCSLWKQPGENASESLERGQRVIATGRLKQRSFEHDGQKRTVVELEVDEIGPSLKFGTAVFTRGEGGNSLKPKAIERGPDYREHAADRPPADDEPPF